MLLRMHGMEWLLSWVAGHHHGLWAHMWWLLLWMRRLRRHGGLLWRMWPCSIAIAKGDRAHHRRLRRRHLGRPFLSLARRRRRPCIRAGLRFHGSKSPEIRAWL
ncbi:hypothetical protein BC940DRAFT_296583, partial [Gongronella butleri]